MSLKKLRNKVKELIPDLSGNLPVLPVDVVEFCRGWLMYEPYRYMWPFLRDSNHFCALLQARQTGKTFNGMAKLLWFAFRFPGCKILVTAPKFDQVKNVAFRALREHLNRMPSDLQKLLVEPRYIQRTSILFRNGSEIRAESPVSETIRGHTAKVIYLMEANFIREDMDLYTAVLFTLNTTDGYLIAESTPWNTDSLFHKIWHKPEYSNYSRHKVTYTDALPPDGPLQPRIIEAIRRQLQADPARWRREMLCEWTEDTDTWLPVSLIANCQNQTLQYTPYSEKTQGDFHIGVDFGKHRDHTVVAVIDRNEHLTLRHMHQFPLGTSYGAVIGYIRQLQDNWHTVRTVHADSTGVGDYIVEDMKHEGIRSVHGVNFTQTSKEQLATALKEAMRHTTCNDCGWTGYTDRATRCPNGCNGTPRPRLQIPIDMDLLNELNTTHYTLNKNGRIQYSHPQGTHDDRLWGLAVKAATERYPNQPRAK